MVQRDRQQYPSILREIFSFPETINEYAARTVAGFIVLLAIAFLYTKSLFVLAFMIYGFLARVVAGPSLSPIALLVTKVIIPKMGNPYVDCPGPPKRFAQFIGLIFTSSALFFMLNEQFITVYILIGILAIFAALESIMGFCAGCWFFKQMMRWGWIPQNVCEKCNDISLVSN
ncbi:MAG: DUF4395 domain-containing protein [Candidatus Marinimicrobia bacterium]|nr:DUF4395 domain-containing protein [Candidatus Neomarinimicrobiota bacterium]